VKETPIFKQKLTNIKKEEWKKILKFCMFKEQFGSNFKAQARKGLILYNN
jgi:hypothetical protein